MSEFTFIHSCGGVFTVRLVLYLSSEFCSQISSKETTQHVMNYCWIEQFGKKLEFGLKMRRNHSLIDNWDKECNLSCYLESNQNLPRKGNTEIDGGCLRPEFGKFSKSYLLLALCQT